MISIFCVGYEVMQRHSIYYNMHHADDAHVYTHAILARKFDLSKSEQMLRRVGLSPVCFDLFAWRRF